jgi:hypothetical protein
MTSRRVALFGYFLLGAILVVVNVKSGWALISRAGFPSGNHFDDLSLVIDWSVCYERIGDDVYRLQAKESCGGYLYGQFLLDVFNFFKIYKSQLTGVSIFLIIASLLTVATVAEKSRKSSLSGLLIVSALIFSPNYFLLMERMNVDIIIVILLIVAALALKSSNFPVAYGLLAATALFKFYTFPLLIFVSIKYSVGKSRIFALLTSTIVAIKIFTDFQKIEAIFPSTWFISFGMQIWGKYLSLLPEAFSLNTTNFNWSIATLFGLIFLTLTVLATRLINHFLNRTGKSVSDLNQVGKEDLPLFEFLAIPYLTCYFINMSYDYRLPLMSLAMCVVLRYQTGVRYRIYAGLALMATWMTVFIPFPASKSLVTLWQLIGDLAMLPLVIALLLLLVKSSDNQLSFKLRGLISWN